MKLEKAEGIDDFLVFGHQMSRCHNKGAGKVCARSLADISDISQVTLSFLYIINICMGHC